MRKIFSLLTIFAITVFSLSFFSAAKIEATTLHDICATMHVSVTLVNTLPSGRSLYIGCGGDSGPLDAGYTKYLGSDHVCHAKNPQGNSSTKDWCKGEVQPVINGAAILQHCSCVVGSPGCLKVLVASKTPYMVNACSTRPTVPSGTGYTDSTCTITKTSGSYCGTNGHDSYPHVTVTCPPSVVSCKIPAVTNVKITCPTCLGQSQ